MTLMQILFSLWQFCLLIRVMDKDKAKQMSKETAFEQGKDINKIIMYINI